MKNQYKIKKEKGSFKKFIKGKGFYIALFLCLLGAAGATFYSVNSALDKITTEPDGSFENVNKNESNVSIGDIVSEEKEKIEEEKREEETKDTTAEENTEDIETAVDPQNPIYIMPINGEIINSFSEHQVVKNQTLGDWRTHDGIDIKAGITTPVKAVSDGTVSKVYDDGIYGTTVVITHYGGVESYYSNLNKLTNVKEGQAVSIGQVIGSVGSTAIAEASLQEHLHFGVKVNGEWADPFKTMGIKVNG